MNSQEEEKPETQAKKPPIAFDDNSDPKDNTLASLERKLQATEDKLLEERFIWIIISIVLFDAIIFTQMSNWAGALVIGILQLIAIVVLADRCQVNTVLPLIDKLTGFANKITGNGDSAQS